MSIVPLALGALRVRLRFAPEVLMSARPGQYVDASNSAGSTERLAVIGTRPGEIDLEAGDDGSALRAWLGEDAVPGSALRVSGPFNALR